MENTFDALKSISENSDIISEYENNQIFKYCYDLALVETREEAIAQNKQEIAKKLLRENIDKVTILKVTGLTEEEIEKIRVA